MIFLFKFKMSHKEPETTRNINNTFGPGTANKCTVQPAVVHQEVLQRR